MPASHPQTSSTPQPWNDGRLLGKMLLKGDVTPGQLRTARLLRRYNYSLPELQGQTITATVLRVTPERVYVDPGFYGVSEVPREELTLGHILSSPECSTQAADRLGLRDVRVGDVVKVRVDEVFTPYGDMQLEATRPDPEMRRRLIWRELTRLMQAGKAVEGRVLNDCPGGFAVGVAGFVALLPYSRTRSEAAQKIGVLQPFLIMSLDEQRSRIVLKDARMLDSRARSY
ncbi:MAG: hypothetical protein WDW36_002365 [Sanguina aurantia]